MLDWHNERNAVALLDAAPESQGIDLAEVRRYRQRRVRAEMSSREIEAVILSDPVNVRYATGTRNMQIFTARNTPSRYLLVTADRLDPVGVHRLRASCRRARHHR